MKKKAALKLINRIAKDQRSICGLHELAMWNNVLFITEMALHPDDASYEDLEWLDVLAGKEGEYTGAHNEYPDS